MSAAPVTERVYDIRAGEPGDHAFVFETWIRETLATRFGASMRKHVFTRGQHRLIEHLLARPAAQLVVACDPNARGTILGWALVELPDVLHFAFTKPDFRRWGIAHTLVASRIPTDMRLRYSHKTLDFERWTRAKGSLWCFDPFEAYAPVPR